MKRTLSHVVGQEQPGPTALRRLGLQIKASLAGHELFTVPNQSMVSTLRIREVRELNREAYQSCAVGRGDVIVYRSPKHAGLHLPSRVIGTAGDWVELRAGKLRINGVEVPEPYLDSDAAEQEYSKTLAAVSIPAGHVFLMGDFRDLSEDSRNIGTVSQNLIVGQIMLNRGGTNGA